MANREYINNAQKTLPRPLSSQNLLRHMFLCSSARSRDTKSFSRFSIQSGYPHQLDRRRQRQRRISRRCGLSFHCRTLPPRRRRFSARPDQLEPHQSGSRHISFWRPLGSFNQCRPRGRPSHIECLSPCSRLDKGRSEKDDAYRLIRNL